MSAESDTNLARDLSLSAMRLNRRLRLRHASDRIPVAQLSILTTIFREGPSTTSELAERERIKPPSVSRASQSLVEQGLLERDGHPTDRRQVVLRLTDAGRRTAAENVAARERVLATQLTALTGAQRSTLAEAARILTDLVDRAE